MRAERAEMGELPELPEALAMPTDYDTVLPSLRAVLLAWFIGCTGLWVALSWGPVNVPLMMCGLGLAATLGAALSLSSRGPRLAAVVLLIGAVASIAAGAWLEDAPDLLAFLSVPVAASAALLPTTAFAATLALAAALPVVLGVDPGSQVWLAVLLGATGITVSAALHPQRSLLWLTWRRSAEATSLAWELREKQGELNRTIKALDLSYQLLEKTNRDLALAQREAVVLRDLRNRFATNLSHELRTPLNILLGFTNLIYHNPQFYGIEEWGGLLLRDLSQVQRNARYLSQLVDDVVDLARIDALAMPMRRELADVAHLVRDAVDGISSLAEAKGLKLLVSCPDDLPEVFIDPVRIRQTIYNLLSNAVRFTDSGEVRVRVAREDGYLQVTVSDTGRGIAASELATIFDEFYQIGRAKEEPDAGKGLGLAIARRFVQLHGGRIWAESTPGEGSHFHFTIPVEPVSTSRLADAGPQPVLRTRASPRVLVLSADDSAVPYLSRRIEGYQFVHCPDLDRAREELGSLSPALMLVDVGLGLDSHRLRAELGERWWPEVPAVFCPLPTLGWLLGDGHFRSVLVKPVTADQILQCVDSVVGGDGGRDGRPSADRVRGEATEPPGVLVVDDDRGFVQFVRRTFEAGGRGYLVDAAYSGEEAVRRAKRARPDCVLLDLVLPGMSGFDAASELREVCAPANVPVIAVTAATPGEDSLSSDGSSFTFTRQGKFGPGELTALIRSAMELVTGEMPADTG
ncbi:MAG: hybrid sensor histidine kinase/response regulator [Anaerolineae bacterium]|nr:hybrid sensor histidine kinase/response regulator [Anaerolineae bacterium]